MCVITCVIMLLISTFKHPYSSILTRNWNFMFIPCISIGWKHGKVYKKSWWKKSIFKRDKFSQKHKKVNSNFIEISFWNYWTLNVNRLLVADYLKRRCQLVPKMWHMLMIRPYVVKWQRTTHTNYGIWAFCEVGFRFYGTYQTHS
jgi:hypothetical protein